MSNPPWETAGMKWQQLRNALKPQDRLIARFGQARLMKTTDARFELRGGTRDDQQQAKEWISLFCHEAIPVVRG